MSETDRSYDFSFNLDPAIALYTVGNEREPVIVVDRVMRDPQQLIDFAAIEVAFAGEGAESDGYPGIRAPAPIGYAEQLTRILDPFIQQAFRLEGVVLRQAECAFSLVTTPPSELRPLQRIPHTDTSYPLQFAVLHYLCAGDFGGTAFYRHKASGFETITAPRENRYTRLIDAELASTAPKPAYADANLACFEQTAAFDAIFDRLLVYRSCLLHSGIILPGAPLRCDPRSGRLTANIFVTYDRA
jgi:hypothetical protein